MSNKPKERKSGFYITGRGVNRKFCAYSADTKKFYELYPRASNPLKDDEITAIDEREVLDTLKEADEMRVMIRNLSVELMLAKNAKCYEPERVEYINGLLDRANQFIK